MTKREAEQAAQGAFEALRDSMCQLLERKTLLDVREAIQAASRAQAAFKALPDSFAQISIKR
jgi:hypothetical protein